MQINFYKYQGIGNDFILIYNLSSDINLKDLAIKLCDRHFGIGGDGLIIIYPKEQNSYKVRIFNSDGSEAEMCGNGIRCVALYINKYLEQSNKIKINTLAGDIYPEVIYKDNNKLIKVNMGSPILNPNLIPVKGFDSNNVINQPIEVNNKIYHITAVSMGNPHCVIFVNNLNNIDLAIEGKLIENATNYFPNKTNVEFVEVINKNLLKVKVWERGAGETLACGTGACAVVVAGVLNNLCEHNCTVLLPGGKLDILWDKLDNKVYLTGEAQEVFNGLIDI